MSQMRHHLRGVLVALIGLAVATQALADPCGMVPPIYLGEGTPIARVGLQQTYVFYKDGIESFAIRPGFTGNVDEFGMLIPFPTPPALRKLPDDIFSQIEAAIDPPEVVIDLTPVPLMQFAGRANAGPGGSGLAWADDGVRVIRQEAVGMYEVAVLEAGSARALKRWMDDHGYRYPHGMDAVCDEYVKAGWCFVAVKTRVGQKQGVDPEPGQRAVNPKLPPGATFDGHVQAMGFRFPTKELVVPMRLSAFNEGELHNVVYILTDKPQKIRSIPEEYVVRQVAGQDLYRNLTGLLPLRVIGGTINDIPKDQADYWRQQRNPEPHNGRAKELFASDLLAVQRNVLSHPHEEAEKVLLRIGEHFGLRGPEIDHLNLEALAAERKKATDAALEDLKQMTLTVVDGDFPREVLAGQNLKFVEHKMAARRNSPRHYDAKTHGPTKAPAGLLYLSQVPAAGETGTRPPRLVQMGRPWKSALAAVSIVVGLAALGIVLRRKIAA